MFIRVKEKANGKKSIQIVETYRRADKVYQRIIRHVGQAVTEKEVEVLKRLAESIIIETKNNRQPVLPLFAPEDIYGKGSKQKTQDTVCIENLREEQRIIEGIGDVFGRLYKDLGFDDILGQEKKDKRWNGILKSCVMARVANPVSKKRTASLLEEDYAIKIPLEKIYRMMDRLYNNEREVKDAVCRTTLNLFEQKVDVLFFDVTTLYFESIMQDDIRDFGYSKDCKFKEVQIVLALVTTKEGLPVTYEIFPGNMYEGHTLISMISELKDRYNIDNILLVADRAMFNEDNLKLMDDKQIKYIIACRLKGLPKAVKTSIIDSDDYKASQIDNELHWIKEWDYNNRRLIVSYNTQRARKDAKDRQRLIERLMKKSKEGKIKVKDLISNYGTKKYLKVNNDEAILDESKIAEDSKWDGLHGVITNAEDISSSDVLSRYHGLWEIEEAFRMSKHDLKMRPIYHWTEERIRAHIAICFLAFTLAKQSVYRMRHQKMPMSFEQIRNELLHVQASIVVDIDTNKRYVIPSHATLNQKRIYQVFGIKRSEVPYAVG